METQTGAQLTRSDAVYLERRGHIAELVLNRPAVLNAENWQMAEAFHAALDELEKAAEIRAVVVTGQGRSFSSGSTCGRSPAES
jgi:enoyl-CoA hydratase/carnithine racemase